MTSGRGRTPADQRASGPDRGDPDGARRFVVRLMGPAGTPVGVGALVTPRRILTCAHVVDAALADDALADAALADAALPGADPTTGAPPGVRTGSPAPGAVRWLHVDFPLLAPPTGEPPRFSAWVESRPESTDGLAADVAVLVLAEDPFPVGARPGVFSLDRADRRRVRAFGYPKVPDRPGGAWALATVRGPVGDGLMQLDLAEDSAVAIQPGYSGSPIVDCATDRIFGMVRLAPDGGSFAADSQALPAERLVPLCSGAVVAPPSVRPPTPADLSPSGRSTRSGRSDADRPPPAPRTHRRIAALLATAFVLTGAVLMTRGLPDPTVEDTLPRGLVTLTPSGDPGGGGSAASGGAPGAASGTHAAASAYVVGRSREPLVHDLARALLVTGAPAGATVRLTVLGWQWGTASTSASRQPGVLSLSALRFLIGGPVVAELDVSGRPGTARFVLTPAGDRWLTVPGGLAVITAMFLLGMLENQVRVLRRRPRVDLATRAGMTLLGVATGTTAVVLAWLVRTGTPLSIRLVVAMAACGAGAAVTATTALGTE